MEILFLLVPVLTVLVVGLAGSKRRLGFGWTVVFAIVLTPVGGLLAALISGPKAVGGKRKRAKSSGA